MKENLSNLLGISCLLSLIFFTAALGPGCQGDEECTPDSQPYKACENGFVYWRYEHCDIRGELIEVCECSCNEEGSGCSDCSEWKVVATFANGSGPEELGVTAPVSLSPPSAPLAFLPYGGSRLLIHDRANRALKLFDNGRLVRQAGLDAKVQVIRAINGQTCLEGICPDPFAGCPCIEDGDCEVVFELEGGKCVSGFCLLPCGSDSYCTCEEICENGSCVDPGGPIDEGDDCCVAMLDRYSRQTHLVNRDGEIVSSLWVVPGCIDGMVHALVPRHDGIWERIGCQPSTPPQSRLVRLMSSEGELFDYPEEYFEGFSFSADGQFIYQVGEYGNKVLVSRVPAANPGAQPEALAEIGFEWLVGYVAALEGTPDGGLLITVLTQLWGTTPMPHLAEIRYTLVRLDSAGSELLRVGLPHFNASYPVKEPVRLGEDGEIYCMTSTDSETKVFRLVH